MNEEKKAFFLWWLSATAWDRLPGAGWLNRRNRTYRIYGTSEYYIVPAIAKWIEKKSGEVRWGKVRSCQVRWWARPIVSETFRESNFRTKACWFKHPMIPSGGRTLRKKSELYPFNGMIYGWKDGSKWMNALVCLGLRAIATLSFLCYIRRYDAFIYTFQFVSTKYRIKVKAPRRVTRPGGSASTCRNSLLYPQPGREAVLFVHYP